MSDPPKDPKDQKRKKGKNSTTDDNNPTPPAGSKPSTGEPEENVDDSFSGFNQPPLPREPAPPQESTFMSDAYLNHRVYNVAMNQIHLDGKVQILQTLTRQDGSTMPIKEQYVHDMTFNSIIASSMAAMLLSHATEIYSDIYHAAFRYCENIATDMASNSRREFEQQQKYTLDQREQMLLERCQSHLHGTNMFSNGVYLNMVLQLLSRAIVGHEHAMPADKLKVDPATDEMELPCSFAFGLEELFKSQVILSSNREKVDALNAKLDKRAPEKYTEEQLKDLLNSKASPSIGKEI